jgi:hypothetical protein
MRKDEKESTKTSLDEKASAVKNKPIAGWSKCGTSSFHLARLDLGWDGAPVVPSTPTTSWRRLWTLTSTYNIVCRDEMVYLGSIRDRCEQFMRNSACCVELCVIGLHCRHNKAECMHEAVSFPVFHINKLRRTPHYLSFITQTSWPRYDQAV